MEHEREQDGTARIAIGAILTWLGLSGLAGVFGIAITGGVFGIVFPLLFGLPVDDWRLDQHSETCTGVMLTMEHDPSFQVNSESTWVLEYACEGVGGPDPWRVRVADSDPAARLREGGAVVVEYLPDDPSVARIQGSRAAIAGWAGLLGLLCAGLGLGMTVVLAAVPLVGLATVISGLRQRSRTRST